MERYLNLWAESLPQLLTSTVAVTIPLSLISFALALLVGIVSAGARTSRFAPVNWLAWLYIWVFRGTRLQTLRYVVIPQAVRIALPNLGNNFIDLIKGTSLVSVISMVDLFQTGKQIASRTFEPLAMYSEVALVYLVIFTVLTAAQSALEKYSNRYVRSRNA